MPSAAAASPLLEYRDVEVYYDQAILALRGVSFKVEQGSIVALLGRNGAGKTTTLRAGLGLLRAARGAITRGELLFRGESIDKWSPRKRVRAGLAEVLEGRHCFAQLSVEENLMTGMLAFAVSPKEAKLRIERIYDHFPRLKERRRVAAGYTSGGEQQMLALGRALVSEPELVLLDEPSMGLAPKIVHEIFEIMHSLNQREGTTFLLAEQNANLALQFAHYGYVLENGHVSREGRAESLRDPSNLRELYFGSTPATRRYPAANPLHS